jgi:tetratricopeptide (TPR) repeat protein
MEEQVNFLPAEAVQRRIREAFRLYVGARAKRRPLALVWEDLHWCDPSSLHVFETLLPLTIEVPLLLICASRPDEEHVTRLLDRAGQAFPAAYGAIALSPLTREQSQSLVSQLLKVENLPAKLRDLIFARAEGNPFFLEELLRSLLDAELIVRNGSEVDLAREITTVDIPETVQGVLTARIDRLETPDKAALQKASVIGRVFQQTILVRLYEPSSIQERRLSASLSELQRREFIQSRQSQVESIVAAEEEFTFKHAITHDVAYGSMLLARRKELHQLAGKAIETLFPDRLEELSATLGYHFERAEAREDAAYYLGRAAERARATFANSEAMGFYRSAIRQIEGVLLSKKEETTRRVAGRLYEGLGDVLKLTGKPAEARAEYKSAESIVPADERIWHSRLRRKAGLTHVAERHYELATQSLQLAEERLGSAETSSTDEWWNEQVQIEMERLFLYYWEGMAVEMQELAARIRSVVEEKGTPEQRGNFFKMLALSHLSRNRYTTSQECLELAQLAVSMSEGSTDLSEAAHIRFVRGFVHLWHGDFEDAIRHIEVAGRLAEKVGDLVIQTRSLTYLAVAHRRAHHVEETNCVGRSALKIAMELGMVEYVAMSKASLAWVAWRERRLTDAEADAGEALQMWHGMEDPYGFDWMALWPLTAMAVERDEIGKAIEAARALFGPNQHPLPPELAEVARRSIEAWDKGEMEAARTTLTEALEAAERAGQL